MSAQTSGRGYYTDSMCGEHAEHHSEGLDGKHWMANAMKILSVGYIPQGMLYSMSHSVLNT